MHTRQVLHPRHPRHHRPRPPSLRLRLQPQRYSSTRSDQWGEIKVGLHAHWVVLDEL